MRTSLWKKTVIITMTAVMLLSLSGCIRTKDVAVGETATVKNHVEFTLENVMISPEVFPPSNGSNPMGWICEDWEKTYVTLIAKIKNLGDEELTTTELWVHSFLHVDGKLEDMKIVASVEENGTVLNDEGSIAVGESKIVYLIAELAKIDLSKVGKAEVDFGMTTVSMSVDTNQPFAVAKTISMGESYKIKGLGKVVPKRIQFTDALEPEKPGYTYDYYTPQTEEDKLLVLTTETTNTTKKKRNPIRYLNLIVFTDEHVYHGDVVAEDEHQANITDEEMLNAGERRKVYGIVNLPKSVKKEDCQIYVYLNGAYYRCEMK